MGRSSKPAWKINQNNYINDYQKDHYKNMAIRFHFENDADIIEHLETVGNKANYIRNLIRADMKKSK